MGKMYAVVVVQEHLACVCGRAGFYASLQSVRIESIILI